MSRRWLGGVVAVAMLVFSAAVYRSLPEQVPTHWNMRGEVDGWSGRFWGAFLMPLVALAMWLFLPWTLESERVWRETHRVAGFTFVLAGLITLASAFLRADVSVGVAMASIAIAALIPTVYSYVVYRRERGESGARVVNRVRVYESSCCAAARAVASSRCSRGACA